MTTTSWTTSATIPLAAWSAMAADIRALLAVSAHGGAKVTGPTGTGGPVLTDDVIGFTVTAPSSEPLVISFTRAPGSREVTTNAAHTDGLVLAALDRAGRHWGQLVTFTSDAGTTGRAVAARLVEALFGAGDRAIAGAAPSPVSYTAWQIIDRARTAVLASLPDAGLLEQLDAVIAELGEERAGVALAGAMLP